MITDYYYHLPTDAIHPIRATKNRLVWPKTTFFNNYSSLVPSMLFHKAGQWEGLYVNENFM